VHIKSPTVAYTPPEGTHRIFTWHANRDEYTAEAFTVRCFDDRFQRTFKKGLKGMGITRIDPFSCAGGARVFASPRIDSDRDFALRELGASIQFHRTPRVMLFNHHDCAAYGGSGRFKDSIEEEIAFHREELLKARAIILTVFPLLTVDLYFIDCAGILEIIQPPQ